MGNDELRTENAYAGEENMPTNSSQARLATKKKPPIWLFIVIGLSVVAVIAAIVIIIAVGNSGSKVQKKITAAEKYLAELDYEKAIAAYNAAIEIDKTSLEAYLGLADVYIAMADELVGKAVKFRTKGDDDKAREAYEEAIGYYNEALEVLDEALDNVSDEDIKKVEKKKDKVEGYIEEAIATRDNGGEGDELDADGSVDSNGNDTADGTGNGASDGSGTADADTAQNATDDFTNSYVGGYVTFGTYEQDGNEANGPEPIEWEVLDINENGMLLVSKYVLDVQPYNVEQTGVTWETCTLRSWLNSDFLNAAFDSDEQSRINTTYVVNADNSYNGTDGGNDTYDKIFCLSVDEILRYYRFDKYYDEYQNGYCQRLITEPTQYAINRSVRIWTMSQEDYNSEYAGYGYSTDVVGKVSAWWWLRSTAKVLPTCVMSTICGRAGVYNFLSDVDNNDNGVRPALYVQLQLMPRRGNPKSTNS